MHEIGIVDDILSIVNARLKEIDEDTKVKRINILVGELEGISPGHIEFHIRERTKGTSLEGVELNFKNVEPRFKCRCCRYEFSAESGLAGCPNCQSKVSDIITGKGIFVESLNFTK